LCGTDLPGFQGLDCYRTAVQRQEFHFVSDAVPVDVNDNAYIASL
jgi:hypothetical protein